ncbi:cobaltochelatase CobN subunit [Sinobacterium caligoides]|uniref:Cobaltochelatase subunit CobN n=1 Tax=Sinobacterium caligoides TaxID=933926 RepID=A0A3N2DYM4_9GAMM|nr:cobaltochelatase subunit CobN [Sinobacterium caligoides]ROS04884.1 cobaltochelatase CobN subunit [Sinobacterium caligoides]
MHLLAAQPGGFVDDEGIIDLQQTPASLVVLSAADSALASLAVAADGLAEQLPSLRLANWMQLLKPAAFDYYQSQVLDHASVVLVSLLGGASYWRYGVERLVQWQQEKPGRSLVVVPGDDTFDPELQALSSVDEPMWRRCWQYLRQGGVTNAQQLLKSLACRLPGVTLSCQEPRTIPRCLLYRPAFMSAIETSSQQAALVEWQQHWRLYGDECWPHVILLFYRSHLQSANTAMFDELIQSLEQQQQNVLPIAIASLKDDESMTLINTLVEQIDAKLIINTTGFASNRVDSPGLSSSPTAFSSPFERPLPVLQVILASSTEDDWQKHSQGLRSRDVAMQVVLPEMDGRIISRAISFKAASHYNERCQISIVRYSLHRERGDFVAELARRYCALSSTKNADKRIALMLANYPTKDGRIGNGVGLDTPASTLNILEAMSAAGYPLAELPQDGNALIEALLESVTNNPNTLHTLPCWQSIAIEEYLNHFACLPEILQRSLWDRWGPPENDPKCRNGRLMIAGIRLGETFVGIQPARGFNLDLSANYHDPDLVPPHSYLACYFWLRHHYKVQAIIHVGKHGNLEWLPGKGTALSNECWPDVILGPMPHFYPFIVNDPGEGAQAKRRTQAVIIDHLMPPMTRAESYGDLAALEALVDEYYQAMGMDSRRETWLREKILAEVKQANLLGELSVSNTADDEQVFNSLDTYLCEIKEAQIRHGLHVLGRLPYEEKLLNTVVALLRLPRGLAVAERGILHVIAEDLALTVDGENFNPLAANTEPWLGVRPTILCAIDDSLWRTQSDTRERLELLAQRLVASWVLQVEDADPLWDAVLISSRRLCEHAQAVLLKSLHESAQNEIGALIKGLQGDFVEPGPSGAPTRGRLDTLPTGRNFYSVDNRSIPSQAAWAIGQASADALIERHLQEQGDYPRDLGLSVWGTATMRTGGDDIAQAFALMGVRPVWAAGSQRVIDIEVIPAMLLGRPRIDVTLRVSGFFRDAFANVMRLFNAAVEAIAKMNENAASNPIRENIESRQTMLIEQGLSEQRAFSESRYRVFGSKPGAYGAGLQGLIDERCWSDRGDLAEAYLNWGGYAYGTGIDGKADGIEAKDAFAQRLGQLQVVVQNQDNREHDLLDSDDYYQFQGGMTNAVAVLSEREPVIYHGDHSNPTMPKVRTLQEELNRVIRSRLLNPKWIEGMREHGYKGAFEMSASVDYMFAYDATTNLIKDYQYRMVTDSLLFDNKNRDFMQKNNPHALEEMAERLLEACQRGMWQEPGEYSERLQSLLLELDDQREA